MNLKILHFKKGFTLAEIAIVIAIIVIIMSFLPSLYSDMIVNKEIYNSALQIHQDLLLIQNLALTHSTDPRYYPDNSEKRKFEIYFYPSLNCYFIEMDEKAHFISPQNYSGKVIKREFSSSLEFLLEKNNYDGSYIAFNNQNIPYPNDNKITISTKNKNKIITIFISQIGRIKIEWEKK